MATARQARGRKTEDIAASHLAANGWPHAERRPASLPGTDVTGVPGLAIEVKARRSLNLTGWLKQAAGREGLPLLIVRPDGYGPERVGQWAAVMRFDDMISLLRQAGYGDPE